MGEGFDVIVIGVGAMGSAACFQLARRGVRVLGIERFGLPHMLGSSGGFSRMIRLAYYEHPDYVPLLRRAYENWHELEQVSGKKLLHLTGGLYMGSQGSELISGALRSAREHSLDHELIDHAELARRYPQFTLPEDHIGILEPMAGMLEPEKCIAAFAEQAMRCGAQIHCHETLRSWTSDASGVTVITDRATYHADKLILTAGAWNGKFSNEFGVELPVSRQTLLWTWPSEPSLFEAGRIPVWGIGQPDGSLYYGFPMGLDDGLGMKFAHHARGQMVDPDRVARDPQPGDEETLRKAIRRFLPRGDGPTIALRVCMYSNTPDSHFIIDRHPMHDRVICGFACSGHGFKFASVIGEVLADLATQGETKLPIGFLGAARLG